MKLPILSTLPPISFKAFFILHSHLLTPQTNLTASMSRHSLKLPVILIKLKPVMTFLSFHLSISKTLITQHTQNRTPDLLPQNLLLFWSNLLLSLIYLLLLDSSRVPCFSLLLKIHDHVPFGLTVYISLGSIHFSPSLYPFYCLIISILDFYNVPPIWSPWSIPSILSSGAKAMFLEYMFHHDNLLLKTW